MKMKGSHFQLIVALYAKIVDCEGGLVVIERDDKSQTVVLNTVMPEIHWCGRCASLKKRANALILKWMIAGDLIG